MYSLFLAHCPATITTVFGQVLGSNVAYVHFALKLVLVEGVTEMLHGPAYSSNHNYSTPISNWQNLQTIELFAINKSNNR